MKPRFCKSPAGDWVSVGAYYDEDGCDWEITINQEKHCMSCELLDDCWIYMDEIKPVLDALPIHDDPTIEDVVAHLIKAGYEEYKT